MGRQWCVPAVLEIEIPDQSISSTSCRANAELLHNNVRDGSTVMSASSIGKWSFDSDQIEALARGYTQVIVGTPMDTVPVYCRNGNHNIGGLYSQMNLQSWLHELFYENDERIYSFWD